MARPPDSATRVAARSKADGAMDEDAPSDGNEDMPEEIAGDIEMAPRHQINEKRFLSRLLKQTRALILDQLKMLI